jgi:ribose transport system substrate-binding protein
MKRDSTWLLLLLCFPLLLMLLAPGCARHGDEKVIGVSLLTRGHVFYRDLEQALRETAAKHGYRLIVDAGEWDLARHQAHIENYIVQRVDAILVCPSDSRGIGPAIEKANQAGIPVFTADIEAFGGQVVSHIASDNVGGGRLAARYLAEALGGKGNIAIIDQPFVKSTIDRVAGFEEEMRNYPDIRIVAKPNGDGVRDRAMKAMEDLLQSGHRIQGLFGINDDSALGALAALEAAGRKDVVIVGFDAIPEARAAILRGTMLKAGVVQSPRTIGELTMETIVKHLNGEEVPAYIPVPVELVDADKLRAMGEQQVQAPATPGEAAPQAQAP